MFSPPSGSLLLILFRKFTRFALLFSDKVWLLLLLLNLYCCCCLSRSCVLLWLVHWRLYATTGVVTALYYTISKKIYHFSSLKRSMKDLHINQKSIINGVKRLTRGLCRVSSKVKNTPDCCSCSNSSLQRVRFVLSRGRGLFNSDIS